MTDLREKSIEVILDNQAESGAYVASPSFPTYRYSWFRDGAFIAHALGVVGEHASASRFHEWAATVIRDRADVANRAIEKAVNGTPLTESDYLHTRYTVDGQEADGEGEGWPNHQLDGFGTWLWALEKHRLRGARIPEDADHAANLAARYLSALWNTPCYDLWEEYPNQIHSYTLAAIHAGLSSQGDGHRDSLGAIEDVLMATATANGHFSKFVGSRLVDASLIGLATPYQVVAVDDPLMIATVSQIESNLLLGGLRRYVEDTYYGGGEWLLLSCWLAWHKAEAGDSESAASLIDWTTSRADKHGFLPEQVAENLNEPGCYEPWRARWGEIASPLLWSHAMYLIAEDALERSRNRNPASPPATFADRVPQSNG